MATYPELHSRVAIVTGAAGGIGAAVAQALGGQKCRVALVDLKADGMLPLADTIQRAGGDAKAFPCDIRDPEAVNATVCDVVANWGCMDILVNCAGISADAMSWKLTDDQWRDVIETNLTGTFHFIRSAAPVLRSRNAGRIINITSINGMRGRVGQANYAASKAGVIGLTKTVARELGPSNITVNGVAPGMIATPMTASLPPEVKERSLNETVLGRLGTPNDVAAVVVFLCSDGAGHITGEIIKVDGGQYI
jgi:NAD(P)-dependent dehydrogenase (short-subunit alcohol dehydrogenase family)